MRKMISNKKDVYSFQLLIFYIILSQNQNINKFKTSAKLAYIDEFWYPTNSTVWLRSSQSQV